MSYEENLKNMSLEADASIGIYTGPPGLPGSAVPNYGKQYCFVKVTGKDQCGLCTAVDDDPVGILQNKPQVPGAAATVGYEGVSNVRVAGAIAAGVLVGPQAVTGRAVARVGGKWRTLRPATAANELVPVMKVS
jgi:hypothetical protein